MAEDFNMTKNNNGRKTTVAIISLIVTIVVVIAAGVKAYTVLAQDVEHQQTTHTSAIETIKEEGCLPARQGKTDIELIKKDIEHIKQGVDKLLERP